MQVIKHITIPESSGETYIHSSRYPATSGVTVDAVLTDAWNNEIATFLSECGVDAYYGVREGYGKEKWLWIRGVPYFNYVVPSNDYVHITPPGTTNSTYFVSKAQDSYIFSFCGNSKKTFIFRIFTSDLNIENSIRFNVFISPLSLKRYPAYVFGNSSNKYSISETSYAIYNLTETSINRESITVASTYYNSVAGLYLSDMGNNVVLIPINHNIARSTPIRLFIDGEYIFPSDRLPAEAAAPMVDSIYQKEILLSGRKFLVGWRDDNASFGSGLIALDDDDPLISEEELMREVET